MTDAERFNLVNQCRTEAEKATDPDRRRYLNAVADWTKSGSRHSDKAKFEDFLPAKKKPLRLQEFVDDGRDN